MANRLNLDIHNQDLNYLLGRMEGYQRNFDLTGYPDNVNTDVAKSRLDDMYTAMTRDAPQFLGPHRGPEAKAATLVPFCYTYLTLAEIAAKANPSIDQNQPYEIAKECSETALRLIREIPESQSCANGEEWGKAGWSKRKELRNSFEQPLLKFKEHCTDCKDMTIDILHDGDWIALKVLHGICRHRGCNHWLSCGRKGSICTIIDYRGEFDPFVPGGRRGI